MQDESIAVVIVTNGPGELSTWVRPIAETLHKQLFIRPRAASSISLKLVLVPCPNATGTEEHAARKWGHFEQITPANQFWNLIINPKRFGIWPHKGLVVFLGGDQFWSVLLSARLKYKHLTYAEWVSRWPMWNDRIAAMSKQVKDRIPIKYKNRCVIVGDLMADVQNYSIPNQKLSDGLWIALLPGSKKAKLSVGVPFMFDVADRLQQIIPKCKFLVPIAPTTSIEELEYFISRKNPIARRYNSSIKSILPPSGKETLYKIITDKGTEIHLKEDYPAHGEISQCNLALTTIGANTSELGALSIPMIVIVPTQHLFVMQAWDGLLGIFARLPGMQFCIGLLLSKWRLKKQRFLAWPNISAGRLIVPEKIGNIYPNDIAKEAANWLNSPARLNGMKEDLRKLRGAPGAVAAISKEIINLIPKTSLNKKP